MHAWHAATGEATRALCHQATISVPPTQTLRVQTKTLGVARLACVRGHNRDYASAPVCIRPQARVHVPR
jgi:hypothetical protein